MTAVTPIHPNSDADALVGEAFTAMHEASRARGALSYQERLDALQAIYDMTRDCEDRIATAISADFGNRSRHETAMAEIFFVLSAVKYAKKHLRGWMKPERRHVSWLFKPAANRVVYQALGVVGIISPWNYPYQLAMAPIVFAIAAGNRILLKPSELTPATSELMATLIAERFSPAVMSVVTGDADVGKAFSRQPFDHLLFTGSTAVGRHVMRAAADNLVPVTLELGGKSPTIVHEDYSTSAAAERIAIGKCFNAGQTCIAPDYVLVPNAQRDAFVRAFEAAVTSYYPDVSESVDYTSIVSERHYERLNALLADAEAKGARIVTVNPSGAAIDPASRRIPPTLVLDVTDDMDIMSEEIFGPLLPVVGYDGLDAAIRYVNDRPRPLALYYFDRDKDRAERVLRDTVSGGACVNETLVHCAQDDIPFGGVGPSGMGAYHGREGFETFSHKKAVFHQSRINGTGLLVPPYGPKLDKLLGFIIGRK